MPEYKITHKDIYICHSFVTAKNEEEALEKFFNNDEEVESDGVVEWFDRYNDYNTKAELI